MADAIKPQNSIDEYIGGYPPVVQEKMRQLRRVIRECAPDAVEAISYGMPTFKLNGNLVHFAAYQHHIGFYPTPSAITGFEKDLAAYKTSKGAVQFPLDQPLPLDLIRRMVAFRVKEQLAK